MWRAAPIRRMTPTPTDRPAHEIHVIHVIHDEGEVMILATTQVEDV